MSLHPSTMASLAPCCDGRWTPRCSRASAHRRCPSRTCAAPRSPCGAPRRSCGTRAACSPSPPRAAPPRSSSRATAPRATDASRRGPPRRHAATPRRHAAPPAAAIHTPHPYPHPHSLRPTHTLNTPTQAPTRTPYSYPPPVPSPVASPVARAGGDGSAQGAPRRGRPARQLPAIRAVARVHQGQ